MLSKLAIYFSAFGAATLALLIALLYPNSDKRRIRRALEKLPGPPVRNFLIGNLADFPPLPERPQFMVSLSQKYGSQSKGAFRLIIGPYALLQVTSPETAREVFSSSKHAVKSFLYDGLHPWLGFGLLTASGEKWKTMRRLTTPAFHFEVLQRFLEVMNDQSDILVSRVRSHVGKGEFEIFELITACALDIICETAMGKKVNAQSIEGHTPYVDAIYQMSKCMVYRFERPYLSNDFIYSLTSSGRTFFRTIKYLHAYTYEVIKERRQIHSENKVEMQRKPAFLDVLLDAQQRGENITDENIREEVDTFMFEGHDTTSASMAWTVHLLGKYPEIQERLYQEICEVVGDETVITHEIINQMKYLDMVLKESLRIYPSVPAIGRRLTEDIQINDVTVPAGTEVGVSIYSIHHNPNYWENPEVFDPERWTPENSEGRDPFQYVPFSAGSRNCIGQKFATNEEKVIISKLVKNFKITSTDENPKVLPELILRPYQGIHVKVEERK